MAGRKGRREKERQDEIGGEEDRGGEWREGDNRERGRVRAEIKGENRRMRPRWIYRGGEKWRGRNRKKDIEERSDRGR